MKVSTSGSMKGPASVWAARALMFVLVGIATAASGCATENKVVKGPHFALSHPDFWKVKSVAKQDGEATEITIGRYSDTVISEGIGATADSKYETSQADVDARIYTFSGVDDGGAPSKKVLELLLPKGELELTSHQRVPTDKGECGQEFVKKYTLFGETREPEDLLKRPGFRTIVVGAKKDNVLYGVLTRVPYEQDTGLYCYNLRNMQLQLQNVLAGLQPAAGPAPASPAAAGAPNSTTETPAGPTGTTASPTPTPPSAGAPATGAPTSTP
ncbi:MAG TPA: hypothetical protein VGG33_02635 [Polyangia bacterium]